MKQKIEAFIKKHSLLQKDDHVVAAVSGGADSMALLYLLSELADSLQISVSAAHADHGLRPEEAAAEKEMVEAFCASRSLSFYTETLPVKEYLSEQGKGVQEQARMLRYQFLEKVMKQCGANVLATGHHGDDQIETMLLRMTSGRALWEEVGISASRNQESGRIIRPMLEVSKDSIYAYCEQHSIPFKEDKSNNSDTYARNRIRHHALPAVLHENKEAREHFQTLNEWISTERLFIKDAAEKEARGLILDQNEHSLTFSISGWKALHLALQRRVIPLLLTYLCKNQHTAVSTIHIEQLLSLLYKPASSFVVNWAGGVLVKRTYDTCTFHLQDSTEAPLVQTEAPKLLEVPGSVSFNEWTIKAGRYDGTVDPERNDVFCLAESELRLPVLVRSRKQGDKLHIAGMTGRKKLNRLFIDEKVPKEQRDSWPVVTASDETILWVPMLAKTKKIQRTPVEHSTILFKCQKN